MIRMKLLQIMALFLTLSSCESCEEEQWDTLPPETQIGANTFGCYVDGELFVPQWGYGKLFAPVRELTVVYDTLLNILTIDTSGKKGDVTLRILNPRENTITNSFKVSAKIRESDFGSYKFSYAGHNWFWWNDGSCVTGNQDVGEIYITKLDTVNKIVSGIFHCKMGEYVYGRIEIDTYVLNPIANITQGRFDVIYRETDFFPHIQ